MGDPQQEFSDLFGTASPVDSQHFIVRIQLPFQSLSCCNDLIGVAVEDIACFLVCQSGSPAEPIFGLDFRRAIGALVTLWHVADVERFWYRAVLLDLA